MSIPVINSVARVIQSTNGFANKGLTSGERPQACPTGYKATERHQISFDDVMGSFNFEARSKSFIYCTHRLPSNTQPSPPSSVFRSRLVLLSSVAFSSFPTSSPLFCHLPLCDVIFHNLPQQSSGIFCWFPM
jgi:hypothetical protein